jgi:hypothetical protein
VKLLNRLLLPTKEIGRTVFIYGWSDRRSDETTRVPVAGLGAPLSTRRRRGGLAMALSLALSVAACTRDTSGPATTSVSPTSGVVTTTQGSSATTAQTRSTSTSSNSTTLVATTTVAPRAKVETDVRASVAAAQSAYSACLVALPACDTSTLTRTRSGPILALNTARINEWNSAGYAVRNRDQFRFVVESVNVDVGLKRAIAIVCIADGSKLVRPGVGPGGADVIVDGTYVSGRSVWDVRLDGDGTWRVYDAPAQGTSEEKDVCPAS